MKILTLPDSATGCCPTILTTLQLNFIIRCPPGMRRPSFLLQITCIAILILIILFCLHACARSSQLFRTLNREVIRLLANR